MGARCDAEIAAPPRRFEIRARRRCAITVANGVLAAAKTFLLRAVVIVRHRQARDLGGFDPRVVDGIGGLRELGADRARSAAPWIGAGLPTLAALEVGQH